MNYLISLLKYAPALLEAILAIEKIITEPVAGATKKQLVLSIISTLAKEGEAITDVKFVALISHLIDDLVSALNVGSIFKRSVVEPAKKA